MKCQQCENEIPRTLLINGQIRWLKKRKLCHICKPLPNKILPQETERKCKKCFIKLDDNTCYKRKDRNSNYYSYCKKCNNKRQSKGLRRLKQDAIQYKGGKCLKCGYNKCISALEFHHRNPEEKDFTISRVNKFILDDTVKLELDKCDLVCSNCHREIHHRLDYDD